MSDESLEAEVVRLRAEIADLRREIERRDGRIAGLEFHVRELSKLRGPRPRPRVPKPMPAHSAGNA
jgi:hypothetical protein